MAVSGRKSSDFKDSFSKGSSEDFDVCCDPCLTADRNVEAKGFCTQCQENLCNNCLDAHKRTKASKHHTLLDQAQTQFTKGAAQQDSSPPCTEPCQIHQTEVIKFFCPTHEAVGCNDCMTLDHRTCNIKYIPDICVGIAKSQEFQITLQEVAKVIDEEDSIMKTVKSAKAANKTSLDEAIHEIETFQKKINDRLEHLKRTMIQEAQKEISSRDSNYNQILTKILQDFAELKAVQSTMCERHAKIEDARAFTIMKQAQTKLKVMKSQSVKKELSRNKINLFFKPSEVLEKATFSTDGLGKLNFLTHLGPSDLKTSFFSLIFKKEITVRTKSDKTVCDINGFAFISPSRLLLADHNNEKLKILDIDQQSVVDEKTLEAGPYDIAILPQNQVAVTLIFIGKILILKTTSKLSKVRSIPVKKECWGITYHQDNLYVVCRKPNSLLVLDMEGSVQKDVMLQAAMNNIALNRNEQHLYISSRDNNCVASITLEGKVTDEYTNNEMLKPRGLLLMKDGSLLVCCMDSGTIQHVTSDLKKGRTLTRDVPGAQSICYQSDNQTIYVGSDKCYHIKVFSAK